MGASTKPTTRALIIGGCVVFAIASPTLQFFTGIGLSASEFAADGNSTLRAAGFTFSIWSVIYLWLIAYAVFQYWPRRPFGEVSRRVHTGAIVATLGAGAWIWAAATDLKIASVAIISLSALALTASLFKVRNLPKGSAELICVWAPLGLLAGWLSIAAALNILTVLTSADIISPQTAPAWAGAGVTFVILAGALVSWTARLPTYSLAIAWGLFGVWSAEQSHRPIIALYALVGATFLTIVFGLALQLIIKLNRKERG